MRKFIALLLWLLPCVVFGNGNRDRDRAEALVRQTLAGLSPAADVAFEFTQASRWLGHRSRPWQTWGRDVVGTFTLADSATALYRIDSLTTSRGVYTSFTYFDDTTLVVVGHGETEPRTLTVGDRRDFAYEVANLTPVFLLRDALVRVRNGSFVRHVAGAVDSVVYRSDTRFVTLAIDSERAELRSVTVISSHEMYGDVTRVITFDAYAVSEGRIKYPSKIVERTLGFEASVVAVRPGNGSPDRDRFARMIPPAYRLEADPPNVVPDSTITSTTFTPGIHLLHLKEADARVLVAEFNEFLLVAGAPLSTGNGELIIREARRIVPEKPIRYFAFGHHHPHYLGGIRAFIHHGAAVLSLPMDTAYVRQLASFRHMLDPDILEREPRPLLLEVFETEKRFSDGEMELRIVHVGELSAHADDFLLFYFPKHKLLFQDELAWIRRDTSTLAAGPRQKGLYDAIVKHNLEVETILQSWPIEQYNVKSEITFEELRRSVEMIPGRRE